MKALIPFHKEHFQMNLFGLEHLEDKNHTYFQPFFTSYHSVAQERLKEPEKAMRSQVDISRA